MKNIVICSDGTGNEFGKNNTNVIETYTLCEKLDEQLVFYDAGVGTGGWQYNEEGVFGIKGKLRALSDQATGQGLQKNVNDAYAILMQNYEEGDQVYLFGFSRGAFTVRSLAGMLHKVGLLLPGNHHMIEYAAKMYNSKDNKETATEFKRTFSRNCPVHFVGVWDTVESLIMNADKLWHNASLNPDVSNGYHAIAIDEVREDFPPAIWDETSKQSHQTIEQVWFAGVHSDVGGWYDERGNSNISLHWMLNHAKDKGLKIDQRLLDEKLRNSHAPIHDSHSGIWSLRGKHIREIQAGAKVHATVFERQERTQNNYRPENLLDISKYELIYDPGL